MKILFISSGNTKNGISPVVESQGISLIKCGHHVDFFTIQGKGFKGYFIAGLKLYRFLKRDNWDLIHAHYGLCGIIALLVNRNRPLVVSFMGDDLLGSNKENGKFNKLSLFFVKVNRLLASKYYKFSIVKSSQMFEVLNVKNATVIPNGVNLEYFFPEDKITARKELNLSEIEIVIVFVSNPQRPEKNWTLAKESVEKTGRSDVRLIAVFDKTHNEIRKWLNAADILILTSLHEGSPNVIKEAMACNCPIVSTAVGDVMNIIGQTDGCYLSSFNQTDITEKINRAIEFSKSDGKTNGYNRIIDLKLDSESIAERITRVYQRALEI